MWLGREYSDLDRQADVNWEWVKKQANLPLDGWTFAPLARCDVSHVSSISQRVCHEKAGCFTYKFQLRPRSPEGFGKHFRMQQVAYDNFPHSAEFTMPRTVFHDEGRQVSLICFFEGQPASEAIRSCSTADEQLTMLSRCGAWLDAYHRSQNFEHREFRPQFTLRYYQTLKNQIQSGESAVAARQLFLRGIEKLSEIAPRYDGHATIAAVQHGDFHQRNLIWNGTQMAGIDVSNDQIAPVGYDIAKILLDFTAVFRSSDGLANEQIVHPATMAAFFQGYKLVGPDDPSVNFLLFARILATLNTVQAKQSDRTDTKQRTLMRLRPIARNAFRKDNRA